MGSVQRTRTQFPPKHFSLRIKSFSELADACKEPNDMYESVVFAAEGYSWKLHLYPNGNKKENGANHISLYLAIDNLPSNQDIYVEFKLFMYDRASNDYLTVYGAKPSRFDKKKVARGYDQFVSLDVFKNRDNGFLKDNSCEFGVELFVVNSSTPKQQTFKMVKPSSTQDPFRSTFKGFSKMDNDLYIGDPIKFGGKTWKLKVYPNGYGQQKGDFLSVFLELVDAANLQPGKQVWAKYTLRVINQRRPENHMEKTIGRWFSRSNTAPWGFPKFMPLGDLHEERKGFVINDNLIVEVEFVNVSVSDVSSA